MLIEIHRLKSNHLYTEGRLYVNDMRNTFTVESSQTMLPVGNYLLMLVNKNARKREMLIFYANGEPTQWKLGIAHSWIGSKKEQKICIGQYLIPGVLYKATPDYERLIKRLEKCQERNEVIHFRITDTACIPSKPIKHWLSAPQASLSTL